MYTCSICYRIVLDYRALKRHISSYHSEYVGSIICNQNGCQRTVPSFICLYKHIRLHHQPESSRDKTEFINCHSKNDAHNSDTLKPCENPDLSSTLKLEANTIDRFFITGKYNVMKFICKQYSKPHFSRKDVDNIVSDAKDLLNAMELGAATDQIFDMVSSEFKRINLLKSMSLYVSPKTINVGCSANDSHLTEIQYIPLKDTFFSFLSDVGIRELIDNYLSQYSETLDDYKDGLAYSKKCQNNQLPYVLYFDDWESGNPLGSHKTIHKVGSIYCSLRCLPPHMYSQLKNIHLVCLFPSSSRERLGNERILAPLISDIELEEKEIDPSQ